MKKVNTVLGAILLDELGTTLIHEHIVVSFLGWEIDRHAEAHQEEREKRAMSIIIRQLTELREKYGVRTIIDSTPPNQGRNTDRLRRVSEQTGLNIITCTGLFREDIVLLPYFHNLSVNGMAQWMIDEIVVGTGLTDVKAGIIKAAIGPNQMTQADEKSLRAAAIAHKYTNAPIYVHTTEGTMGREVTNFLTSEGANPSKVIIGHSCFNSDLKYHVDLFNLGVFVGYDQIGSKPNYEPFHPQADDIRLMLIAGLIIGGYANQILLSQDVIGYFQGRYNPSFSIPQHNYTDLFKDFIPKLIKAGISPDTINQILLNPKKLFE